MDNVFDQILLEHGFTVLVPMIFMSVFLMPMWLLSGAFFPGGGEDWLSWIIRLNPLTYGVAGLRRLLYSGTLPVTDSLPSMPACVGVTVVFSVVICLICVKLVSRPMTHNVT